MSTVVTPINFDDLTRRIMNLEHGLANAHATINKFEEAMAQIKTPLTYTPPPTVLAPSAIPPFSSSSSSSSSV
jgi:hypothetical protein